MRFCLPGPNLRKFILKSSLNVNFANVHSYYFSLHISQDKESNIHVIKYFYSSSLTATLSNYVTTCVFTEDYEEPFKVSRNI